MGDPRTRNWVSKKRKRNFIAKKLWEDGRFRHKAHRKAIEVRAYEDERDAKQEIEEYLSEDFDG